MTQIEQIKVEIERLKKKYGPDSPFWGLGTTYSTLEELLSFINTIPQEQPQGLDEAAEEYKTIRTTGYNANAFDNALLFPCDLVLAFKSGAMWDSEQGETSDGVVKFVKGLNNDEIMVKVILKDLNPEDYRLNEKVSVQIRRK